MIGAPETQNRPPRANAGSRANIDRNEIPCNSAASEPEENFAALYLARRYHLALPVAQTIAALANLGRAFG
jgi:hypothetical protein